MVVIANNARAKIYESGEVKSEIIVLHVASVTNNYANFSPSKNYTGRKIRFSFFFFVFFFLRSSTKYTPWRSAKAKREGRRFAEKSHYFQRVCDVFRDERGPEKKLQFFKRKIVTAENRVVPQSVSLSCNYHVFPRLEQPLQGVSLSRTHAKRRLPGKLLPGFRMKE